MGDTFVAIVETLRHEDETKSKKLHAFECKVSSRPLGSELNQLVETGDGHNGIKWPRSRLPHLQRQRREYQTTRSVVPLQKLIDFDNGARALHTPEANKEIGKAKRSSSRTRVRSDPNSDTKDPDEYLRLLFWNNGEGKTKAPRIHRLLTKASVKEKLRKLETHNALNPGSVDAYLDRAFGLLVWLAQCIGIVLGRICSCKSLRPCVFGKMKVVKRGWRRNLRLKQKRTHILICHSVQERGLKIHHGQPQVTPGKSLKKHYRAVQTSRR